MTAPTGAVCPSCGGKAALAWSVYCDLPAGHEGPHALHEEGKVYWWGPGAGEKLGLVPHRPADRGVDERWRA